MDVFHHEKYYNIRHNRRYHTRIEAVSAYRVTPNWHNRTTKREARRADEIFESRYILLLNARELFRFFLFQLSRTYRIPLNAGLYHPRPHLAIFLRAPSSKLMEFINSVWLESATSLFLFKDGLLECPPMVQHPLTVERKLLVRSFFFIL